ncbi:unnamed protein product [Caenorhabditis auriculariae]|uniref:Transcription factor CBF/NF-Y/archaeal histone domain-containing protein n=1 Tax=Caenorhabditis auriculariae TaxID=2777116 RepID=A0A8S1HMW1_9PELO|nr:unnamed protein product [Caenorhabditis auriculariae]
MAICTKDYHGIWAATPTIASEIPLDYVKSRVKIVKDDLLAEEEAFVAISKAAETFLRNLARESSNLAGNEPISYDDIANVVHKLPFHELREFLPQRMTYEAVQRRLQALQENRDENDEDDDD